MAENRRGRGQGFYYLSRGQLLVLAGGFMVASVVVFLLGILIGQGIEERKLLKREEPLVKIPAQPLPQGATVPGASAKEKEEMSFYETLAKAPAGAPPTRVEPIKGSKPVEKSAKPVAKEVKLPEKEARLTPAEKIEKIKPADIIREKTAAEKIASIAEVKKEPPVQKTAPAEASKTETEAHEKVWAVQVNAYLLDRDAKNLAKKLKDKGYDAYVVPTSIKGRTWHRVRVGRLETQDEAKVLQEKLKTKENFTKSITTSR